MQVMQRIPSDYLGAKLIFGGDFLGGKIDL